MERAALENDIAKLERLARARHHEQRNLVVRRRDASARAELMDRRAELCDAAVGRRVDTRGDRLFRHDQSKVSGTPPGSPPACSYAWPCWPCFEAPPPKDSVGQVERTARVGELGGFRVDVDVT